MTVGVDVVGAVAAHHGAGAIHGGDGPEVPEVQVVETLGDEEDLELKGELLAARQSLSEEMQKLLNRLVKNANLAVDGKFGPKTTRALEDWQRANGQAIDGAPTRENLEKLRQAA